MLIYAATIIAASCGDIFGASVWNIHGTRAAWYNSAGSIGQKKYHTSIISEAHVSDVRASGDHCGARFPSSICGRRRVLSVAADGFCPLGQYYIGVSYTIAVSTALQKHMAPLSITVTNVAVSD